MNAASDSDQATVVVVGLGPAGPGLATVDTIDAIQSTDHRFIRTTRHPSASLVEGARSFDTVYDAADTIGDVYTEIVERLVAAARRHDRILYAVPGSPAVAEHTVELLVADERIETTIVPALSFADLAWVRLGVDPLAEGARIVDGHRFESDAAGERGPLLVAQCDTTDVLSRIKLSIDDTLDRLESANDELMVTVLARLGLDGEHLIEVPWHELDRQDADHLTSLWIPRLGAPISGEVARFVELVTTLRRECPWDSKQTHGTLRPHLLEETYEVLEALDAVEAAVGEGVGSQDADAEHSTSTDLTVDAMTVGTAEDEAYELLEEELGDLLFQVVFHAVLGAEAGRFTMADVAHGIHDKLRSRHPHVFADVEVTDANEVVANWEAIKAAEKQRESVLDGIPPGLPALAMAQKVIHRAEHLQSQPGLENLVAIAVDFESIAQQLPTDASSLGDMLLAIVARLDSVVADDGSEAINAEEALRLAVARAEAKIRAIEAAQTK